MCYGHSISWLVPLTDFTYKYHPADIRDYALWELKFAYRKYKFKLNHFCRLGPIAPTIALNAEYSSAEKLQNA